MSKTSQPPETNLPGLGMVTGNPFYDVWCRILGLSAFLRTDDLKAGTVDSLLNGGPIDRAADYIERFAPAERRYRPYLGVSSPPPPLRIVLTMTNLHGIPYRTVFDGPSAVEGETFLDHADHLRFAVAYRSPASATLKFRKDETVLSFDYSRYPHARRARRDAEVPRSRPPRGGTPAGVVASFRGMAWRRTHRGQYRGLRSLQNAGGLKGLEAAPTRSVRVSGRTHDPGHR